jgi:hypothetical protein
MFTIAAAVLVLIIAVLVDPSYFQNIIQPDIQIVLGTFVVAIILLDNAIAGLIMGLAVFVIYMRVYADKYGITLGMLTYTSKRNSDKYPMKSLLKEYITPEHLKDAQDNTFDNDSFNKSMIGIRGVYGEAVYSAQGIDKVMPGFEKHSPLEQMSFK